MEYLYIAFEVVYPLFFLMALGFILNKFNILPEKIADGLSTLCYKVLLPFLMFLNIYNSDFSTQFNAKLIALSLFNGIACFLIFLIVVPIFEKKNINRGVIIQGSVRSNFVLFGIPMALSLYGAEHLPVFSIVIAFAVPLLNIISVIALEIFAQSKQNYLTIIKKIFKNPIIISAIIGFAFVFLNIELPTFVVSGIADIGNTASPISLVALGATFKFNSLSKYPKQLISSVFCKLIVMPLICVTLGVLVGFRGVELAVIFTATGSPTAVSSFPMAKSVNANDELAGQILVISSIFSIITIFVWVSALKYLQLI